jgi:hypothetical protein
MYFIGLEVKELFRLRAGLKQEAEACFSKLRLRVLSRLFPLQVSVSTQPINDKPMTLA